MIKKTILKDIYYKGYGTFNGLDTVVKLSPAKSNNGIKIIRTDLFENNIIQVNNDAIYSTNNLNTAISNGYCEVLLIEHLISALYSFKITDINIYVNTNEIPLLDGSAKYWERAIRTAGVKELDEEKNVKYIEKEIKYIEDDKYIIAKPCDYLKIQFTIDFPEQTLGHKTFVYNEFYHSYSKELALARTFCTEKQLPKHKEIKKKWNNEGMIVYSDHKIDVIDHKLRYTDEAVRHKILDVIGDLYSTGDFIIGEFICYKSGHDMNRKLINLIYHNN